MKIVYFEWKDAFANAGWFKPAELKALVEDCDMWAQSAGFLLRKTRRFLIVCTTIQFPNANHGVYEPRCCNVHKIPITWIRNYRVLGDTALKGKK